MLLVERKILVAVERPADPDLDHPARIDEALFDRAAERRSVEVLRAEVLVPGVRMRVEVHEAEAPVTTSERPQDGQGDRVIAAHADGHRALRDHLAQAPLDRLVRALDRDRHHVHVTAIGHAHPLEGMDLEDGIPGTDQRRLLAHGSRPEAGSGPIRGPSVVRDAEQGDVEVTGRGYRRQQHERRDLAESRRDERVPGARRAQTEVLPRATRAARRPRSGAVRLPQVN